MKKYRYDDSEFEADDDIKRDGKKSKKRHRPDRPGKRAWLDQASENDEKNQGR